MHPPTHYRTAATSPAQQPAMQVHPSFGTRAMQANARSTWGRGSFGDGLERAGLATHNGVPPRPPPPPPSTPDTNIHNTGEHPVNASHSSSPRGTKIATTLVTASRPHGLLPVVVKAGQCRQTAQPQRGGLSTALPQTTTRAHALKHVPVPHHRSMQNVEMPITAGYPGVPCCRRGGRGRRNSQDIIILVVCPPSPTACMHE